MADAKRILGGLGKLGKAFLSDGTETVTAAQRAEAGRKAAALIKSQPQTKASEALGQQMEKGVKRTSTTQADRTRVGGGNIGGAPFSALSEADPAYKGKVWGVMDEGTASRLKNLTTDDTAWTTMLGSANQLKTNPIVFDKLKRQFIDSMKQGNLSPELEAKINHNLALTFGEGAQIRDPKIWREADTFEKRAALADLMMGKGVTPKKGGLALGGEKSGKGVIFKPTDTLKRETEPSLLHTEHGGDAPTFAAGPRLFKLEKESVYRPDLHPGFPTLLTGKDLDVNMIPTPTEVYLPDWHKKFKKNNPDRKSPGYYDLALGVKGEGLPSQDLNDEYIRHLLREGFKKGGAVDIDAADRRLAQAMSKRMASGGSVDLEAADARLKVAMEARMGMAEGGGAFKKLAFMADGGKIVRGVTKGFKRLFSDQEEASQAIGKAAESAGMKAPVTANKPLTNIQDFYTSFGDAVRDRAMKAQNQMDSWDYKYSPGQYVFTEHGAKNNLPPLKIMEKSRHGWNTVREDPNNLLSKRVIDPETGKAMRTPYEPGYRVRRENGEDWSEFIIPESIIKGDVEMADGGAAFKKLQFMDVGGIATSGGMFSAEDLGVTNDELNAPLISNQRMRHIKKTSAEILADAKKDLESDYDRLNSSGRARAQLAKIRALQMAGGLPDVAHLGVDMVLDPLKSMTIDKLLTKPKPRSVLERMGESDPAGESQERVPMFGSISDALKTDDGLPIGSTEHMIKRAQDAGLMYGSTKPYFDKSGRQPIDPETGLPMEIRTGRFSPITEIGGAILGGIGLTKLANVAKKGYIKNLEPRVNPAGALSRAITDDSNKLLPSFATNPLLAPQSVKLTGLQPEAKTASTGTPQGVTYATKQDGPFYRVSPTSLDVSGGKNRGLRETDELQGQAPIGGGAGQAGREVPQRIPDEEVARLISNPETNQPLQIAQRFTKETQGTDFAMPNIPESSLAKQSAIGRAHQLAVEGSPEYKTSVFDAYAKQMPDLLEQVGAKDYDDLMEKAYRQLAKETDEQFQRLPYNFSYHKNGEGSYGSSKEMVADVHGNRHLYVYQGGDPHDFLNRMDKASGLNENEKFRAVHDLLGHAVYGNQFGPRGEEIAYAVHQQMYSPLARLAMASETRGQNSIVNYSPLNVKLKSSVAKLENLEAEALRRRDTALVARIRADKKKEYDNFQFAPQKAVLLPPEFINPQFAGGMPDYLSAANRPAKGTESQSVLTHFSHDKNLQMLDPTRYGTGIKGAEAERLREYAGGVKDRSYFYMGEPGTVAPEAGLGVNRYRGESQNLYDITKDPLSFRALARESNRNPYTSKYNAGIAHPLQDANDYERLVKEYGYDGMINPNSSKPMGIMFKPTPVQPRKRGGLTQIKAR